MKDAGAVELEKAPKKYIIHPTVARDNSISYKARIAWSIINALGELTIPDLAELLGCSETPASQAVRELEYTGYLNVARENGKKNVYSVTTPL